jgi:NhaA family Na+:H+ antiporter
VLQIDILNQPSPIERMSRPFLRFLHIEAAGGIVLLICTALALILANSPWAQAFLNFWQIPITISFGDLRLSHSLGHWINDGLMTIFFFVVGLEIKRELVAGELKNRQAAMLPIVAALGGMIVPALFYTLGLRGNEGAAGWGIPMATDIAFVVGFLSLFGKRVPHGLKIFILSLAIVDDLGAILIIAAVYSTNISVGALALGFLGLGVIVFLNRLGVRRVPVYVFVGGLIWLAFLTSGVHPTIAGVLLGLLTPASAWIGNQAFLEVLSELPNRLKSSEVQLTSAKTNQINHLISKARESVSPLERLEVSLHPWVAFFIMPLFALANAGVPLAVQAMTSPVSIAVTLGLVLGKPLGIFLFSWLTVKFLGGRLPDKVNWSNILGAGFLAGIGFTMSIFIASLALDGGLLVEGKVGTLLGSSLSAIIGLGILYFVLPRQTNKVQ